MDDRKTIIITGIIVGVLGAGLVALGNPLNMGFCIACFVRDIAGGLGLHRAGVVQFIRPEVIGLILGASILAIISREFRPMGGSSPVIRFVLGVVMMIGALVFLGCPLRMVLRLAGGDLNAIFAFLGFIGGIILGTEFLKRGYSLGRSYEQNIASSLVAPIFSIGLFILVASAPSFIFFSEEGPGANAAPILITLLAGLIVGALAQRSRLCMAGGIRDIYLIQDFSLFSGFIMIFIFSLVINLGLSNFNLGFDGQPVAHTEHVWNFLSMGLVGLSAILLGGCPLRQLILAGNGDGDAMIVVFGMIVGGAIAHNFGTAASPNGVPLTSQIAVILGFPLALSIAFSYTYNLSALFQNKLMKGDEDIGT